MALQQIKGRGALPMIEVMGDIIKLQSMTAAISTSCRRWTRSQFEHKADGLIAKFKEAGGTVREIDV